MDYAAEQERPYRAGRPDAAKLATPEQPRLYQQVDQLMKVLAGCHDAAGRLERVADRIIGPVPEKVQTSDGRASQETLERRLAEIVSIAEGLSGRLNNTSQRLDSAV